MFTRQVNKSEKYNRHDDKQDHGSDTRIFLLFGRYFLHG